MLEKLIASLKESLPEPLRKKLGMEDNNHNQEQSSDNSDEVSEESHDTSDNENDSSEDKKKKQISMIIRVVVVLALAYLAIDQFILKSKDPSTEIADIFVKPRKPRKKIATDPGVTAPEVIAIAGQSPEVKPEELSSEKSLEVAATPETAIMPEAQAPESASPVENINITDKKMEEVPPPAASEAVVANALAVGEVKSNEAQIDKNLDSLIESVDGTEKANADSTSKKEMNLEDKIVADDVFTPPPAYDQLGRGLVYNCKEKYWACIDKIAYVACNKNMKWNKAHGKPAECVVQNVYNSDDDCSVVQKYNVSTSKATPFCQ